MTLQDIVVLQNPKDPTSGVIFRTGLNVICISAQQEVKNNIRLTGDATTRYTFAVQGQFSVGCCKAVLDGSVIIDGTIALSPGLINGAVCGSGDWRFVSGSGVHCPDP